MVHAHAHMYAHTCTHALGQNELGRKAVGVTQTLGLSQQEGV